MKRITNFLRSRFYKGLPTWPIVAIVALYLFGVFGFYVGHRNQLNGVAELNQLISLNDSVTRMRNVVGKIRRIIERVSANNVKDNSEEVVLINAFDDLNLYLDKIQEKLSTYDRYEWVGAPDLAQLVGDLEASIREVHMTKTLPSEHVMRARQLAFDLRDKLLRIQLSTSEQADQISAELFQKRYSAFYIGVVCATVSVLLIIIFGFRIRRELTKSFQALSTDIDKRRHYEGILKKQNETLTRVNDELEAFSYSVSHDLRVPLRSIDHFSLALLEEQYQTLGPEGRIYLDRIRAGVQRMGALIDDILDLARYSKGEVESLPIEVSQIVSQIASELEGTQPNRNVTFDIQPEVRTMGDPTLMRIALSNLLENSWKYTSHRPTAKIQFGTYNDGGKTVFYVKDDGIGFDMKYSDRLFRAFHRLHSANEFSGNGIGLAIVERIIKRHGGKIWAEGKVESGATFYFTLN